LTPKRRKTRKAASPQGISFEKAVAAIQQLLDPNATVTHNERLVDRLGHARQFDVVLRGKFGGHDVLGVIECKDLNRPVGTPVINAFANKVEHLRAHLSLVVSRKGFSKQALELARHHGIGTLSLLREDFEEHGYSVAAPAFGELFQWGPAGATVYFVGKQRPTDPFTIADIYFGSQNLLEWLQYQLFNEYQKFEGEGLCIWYMQFPKPSEVSIRGVSFYISSIKLAVPRIREKRTKRLLWAGKALYDWDKQRLILPRDCHLVTEAWRFDLSDWESYDGEIPPMGSGIFGEMRIKLYQGFEKLQTPSRELEQEARIEFVPPAQG
jgi:hypothetical protein